MQLLESFALTSGRKINKINILEKYYSIPFEKYIVIQPFSKDSKNYDYWSEVLYLLYPILNNLDYKIIQIGGKNEKPLEGCYHTQGTTNINQVAYIIKHAQLFLGADSFGAHLAGHYNIPLVTLYSNNYIDCVYPYFGDKSKQIFLEPNRPNNEKPSFSFQESPKTINRIMPEIIAGNVCKLLNISFSASKTIHFGPFYNHARLVEMSPDIAVNLQSLKIDSIIVRMDYNFNEEVLVNQLRVGKCGIVSDKPIKQEILETFKNQIIQFVYIITENNNPEFAKYLHQSGINYVLISSLSEEELNKYKLDYVDTSLIHRKDIPKSIKDTPFKDLDPKKLKYKSNKIILAKQKIYFNKAAMIIDQPVSNVAPIFLPVIDTPDFWADLDFMMIVSD